LFERIFRRDRAGRRRVRNLRVVGAGEVDAGWRRVRNFRFLGRLLLLLRASTQQLLDQLRDRRVAVVATAARQKKAGDEPAIVRHGRYLRLIRRSLAI